MQLQPFKLLHFLCPHLHLRTILHLSLFLSLLFLKGEFAESGTETHFTVAGEPVFIRAVSSGHRRKGILHSLVVDGQEIDPCNEAQLLNIKSKQTPK